MNAIALVKTTVKKFLMEFAQRKKVVLGALVFLMRFVPKTVQLTTTPAIWNVLKLNLLIMDLVNSMILGITLMKISSGMI